MAKSRELTDRLLQQARAELTERDPRLAAACKNLDGLRAPARTANFEGLIRIIVGQQLSGAAAKTIFSRVKALASEAELSPKNLLALEVDGLRSCGVSVSKIRFIREIAGHFKEQPHFIDQLRALEDDHAMLELTKLRGIGQWSAGVFLLFYLRRPDIFPSGDTTLLKAISKLYGIDTSPERPSAISHITERWRPYRSVAALMLWGWIDSERDS